MLDQLKDTFDSWQKTTAWLSASAASVFAFWKVAVPKITWAWGRARYYLTIGDQVLAQVDLLKKDVQAAKDDTATKFVVVMGDLDVLKKEIKYNAGSSIKDAVTRLEAHRGYAFIMSPYPAFECSDLGVNMLVSDAYRRLVGAETAEVLLRRHWQQFIHQGDLHSYNEKSEAAFEARSMLRAQARLNNVHGKSIGRWEIRAQPVGDPNLTGKVRYIGSVHPIDVTAVNIQRAMEFSYPLK